MATLQPIHPSSPESSLIETHESDNHELSESVRKATRTYVMVGAALFIGTLTTVAVATVPWLDVGEHGFDKWDALLGLSIATIKASLVALIFMHLNHERRFIYFFMGLAAIHCVGMAVGTLWHDVDLVHDKYFFKRPVPQKVHEEVKKEAGRGY